MTGQTETNQYN